MVVSSEESKITRSPRTMSGELQLVDDHDYGFISDRQPLQLDGRRRSSEYRSRSVF